MYLPGQYQYQMGYTEAEFDRALHAGFTSAATSWRCHAWARRQWLITDETSDLQMQINIQPLAPRQLGLLQLPVLQVSFVCLQGDADSEQRFFSSFFKYFHKGGG